jgi:hypothetical protein
MCFFLFFWFQRWCLGVLDSSWEAEGEFVRLRSFCTFMMVYWWRRLHEEEGIAIADGQVCCNFEI